MKLSPTDEIYKSRKRIQCSMGIPSAISRKALWPYYYHDYQTVAIVI